MPAIDEQSRTLTESRLESLVENSADIGPEWRQMVGGMRDEASQLAVEAVQLATQREPGFEQVQGLAERFESLGDRVGGVGLTDLGAELKQAADAIGSSEPNALTNASARALDAAHGLDQVAEMSKEFDQSMPIPAGETSTLAQAPAAEAESSEYGGFAKGWPQGGLVAGALSAFDGIDSMLKENGMTSLRDSKVGFMFKDFGEVLSDVRESLRSEGDGSAMAGLESQLGKLGEAQQGLAEAQGALQTAMARGGEFDIEIAQDKVLHAEAAFTAAEAGVMGSLEQVSAEMGVTLDRASIETSEATLVEFLEAGGQVDAAHIHGTQQLDDLAGLTVRELGAVGDGPMSIEDSKDVAAMLDNLADRAEANGLAEVAGNLRDAAAATLEGPDAVDMGAVQDYVSEVKDMTAGLRETTEEFGIQMGGEFTRDEAATETSMGAVEATEVAFDPRDFAQEAPSNSDMGQEMDTGKEMDMVL